MKEIDLIFDGPYPLVPEKDDILFNCPYKDSKGIYLWLIEVNKKNIIIYLGMTTRTFYSRTKEHLFNQLSGIYSIKEPELLKRGLIKNLWDGLYGKKNKNKLTDYIRKYKELAEINFDYIKMHQIMVAPLNYDNQVISRIEGAIAREIKKNTEYGRYLDSGIRYPKHKSDDNGIEIRIKCPIKIEGLNNTIKE